MNDINEWNHVSADIRQHEKFINLISLSAPSMSDSLYKQLGRNTRWFWEISKVYEDTNVLIHICVNYVISRLKSIILFKKKKKKVSLLLGTITMQPQSWSDRYCGVLNKIFMKSASITMWHIILSIFFLSMKKITIILLINLTKVFWKVLFLIHRFP